MLDFMRLYVRHNVRRFVTNEAGATAIEYGLIAALVGVVIITAVTTLGTKLTSTFNLVSASLKVKTLIFVCSVASAAEQQVQAFATSAPG